MNEKQQNKLIPKLRFPEFKNSGEWKEKPLSELLDYERPDKYIVSDTMYKNEGIPVLTANKSFILGYTDENFGVYNNLPAIIFDDFTVDNKYVDFPFKVKSSAIKILTAKEKDNLRFVYELMSQIKFDAIQHKRYYISQYQNLVVPVPHPKEQQKIADFLSNLDELIEAHKRKLELLKKHKKGLMQNLFPQEGKKVPKLRFSEFKDSGEWVEKPFELIFDKVTSKKYQINSKEYLIEGKYPVIDQGKQKIVAYSNDDSKVLKNKSIIIFGDHTRIFKYIDFNFIVGADGTQLIKTKKGYDNKFFYYQLLTKKIPNTGYNRHFKFLKEKVFQIPPIHKEQQKIADFLSSLDELINATAKKIEQLEKHKKGLMQGLFPEITNE